MRLTELGNTDHLHRCLEFVLDDYYALAFALLETCSILTVDRMLDTLLSISNSEVKWASHTAATSSQANRFQYVRSSSDSAIDEDLHLLKHFGAVRINFHECQERWLCCVDSTTSVIRDENACTTDI